MLIQLSVDNFRSFGSTETFSMVPDVKYKGHLVGNDSRYHLLPSAVFYGANASGKSNFLKAFSFMQSAVLNRSRVSLSTDPFLHDPFLLSKETEDASSSFEIVFVAKGVKYRYGFDADRTMVYSEWLFADSKGQEAKLFFRDVPSNTFYINPTKFKEGKNLKCLPNWLFLWKCNQENGPISKIIMEWFANINILDGMVPSFYTNYTKAKMNDPAYLSAYVEHVRRADLSIEQIQLDKKSGDRITTLHKKFGPDGQAVGERIFDLIQQESLGTQKFLFVLAPIIDTLENGRILLIDEFDASLHPLLSAELVKMFNDPSINTNNAQLVFTSHDTNLLGMDLFDYCQIWFAEKDASEQTHIKSLSSYLGVNKRKKIDEQYLRGVFGAIPNIVDFLDKGVACRKG